MVAGKQDIGHAHAAEISGTRVLLVLEEASAGGRGEALVHVAHVVAERTGNQAHHGVRHDERRELAAGEHVVADAEALVRELVGPLVHTLVATADHEDALATGEALGHVLIEDIAAGREEDHMGLRQSGVC